MAHVSQYAYACNLLIYIVFIAISNALSDRSDFTYYYKTYHYTLGSSPFVLFTAYNDVLHLNITATPQTLFLHHDNQPLVKLDLSNDNLWDEISSIQTIHTTLPSPQPRSSRLLLQEGEGGEGMPPPPPLPPLASPLGGPAPGAAGGAMKGPQLKIYTGHSQPTTYQAAEAACRAQGSILATAQNSQQNNNIMRECNKFGANIACWIGLKKPFGTWTDGKPVMFKDFAPGQPKMDGTGGECVEVYPDGRWGATSCDTGRSYICQKIEPGLPSATSGAPVRSHGGGGAGGGGGGGCHPHYGCGQQHSPCAVSPCYAMRRKEEGAEKKRQRTQRRRKRERRMRRKWRLRLRRLRERKDRKLKRALRKLKEKHTREGATYSWIADLLQRKVLAMQNTGQMPNKGQNWRRRMITMDDDTIIVQRCKGMMQERYDVCVGYDRRDKSMDLEIRYKEKQVMKVGDHGRGYKEAIDSTRGWFNKEYKKEHPDDEWVFNPIEGSVGYVVDRHEEYIHFFRQFEFDLLVDVDAQCSVFMKHLPFRMCLRRVYDGDRMDIVLYFEKEGEDKYEVNETYSFEVKEYIDDGFENNVFSFNINNDWDEVHVSDIGTLVTKCTHKLLIAKACIDQVDAEKYRASITFKAKNTRRNKP